MAGMMAEIYHLDPDVNDAGEFAALMDYVNEGAAEDYRKLITLSMIGAADPGQATRRCNAVIPMARAFVVEHWPVIAAIASELVAKRTLTARAILSHFADLSAKGGL